jgi:hypothetical protein
MMLSARQLNRATLDRQMLLRRQPVGVVDAVRRVVALQSQSAASPYLALWNRIDGFEPAELDAAYTERAVVKATLMRVTLHTVTADDYPDFHNAMQARLRAARLADARTISTGGSVVPVDQLLPPLARFAAQPRTEAELAGRLAELLGEHNRPAWRAVRTIAPLHHLPTGGPWSFRSPASFVAARSNHGAAAPQESVRHLLLRYLHGFGPATAQDCAQFTFLRQPDVLAGLRSSTGEVVELPGPDGATFYDVAGAPLPAEDVPAPPRLLPMWDSVLLAYANRTRVVPAHYRPVIYRRNGDVLPTLLVDGHVTGVWRVVDAGIEATAFHPLDEAQWDDLATEASALLPLLGKRERTAYRRYDHWWDKGLPAGDVRVLPGSSGRYDPPESGVR